MSKCKCGREAGLLSDVCSVCQAAAERHEEFVDTMTANTEALERAAGDRERDLERAAESAERAAYLTNNPGAYECPTCKMISLKYGASCCPKCQKYVPEDYWQRIREQERVAAERARVWLASPEYAMEVEAAARAEAEKKKKEVAQEKTSKILTALGTLGAWTLLGWLPSFFIASFLIIFFSPRLSDGYLWKFGELTQNIWVAGIILGIIVIIIMLADRFNLEGSLVVADNRDSETYSIPPQTGVLQSNTPPPSRVGVIPCPTCGRRSDGDATF